MYGRRDERSELRLQYYGLEKCDKQRLKPAMRSPNFWAGCSQDPAAINHWPRGNYILCCLITVQIDACLAVVV